jgi:8-oxo-dGTP pyrophosphatase MutT (NUDIX family)
MERSNLVEAEMTDRRIAVLSGMVDAWAPSDERGEASRVQMLEFLSSGRDSLFARDPHPDHITGSAIVISSAGVLLHRHKLAGTWMGPGGHVDGDELPWEAAVRETVEETGIMARLPESGPQLLRVDVHHTVNGHVHYDVCCLLLAEPDEPSPPPEESQDVAWFGVEEALERVDGGHGPALRVALASGVLDLR